MLKFHCKRCSGKIGVKDEYAGKRVRCPKCKQPVRVPAPAADEDDFELEMVVGGNRGSRSGDAADSGDDDFELEMVSAGDGDAGGSGADLAALAAMEAGATATVPSAGKACPSCGTTALPGAALCVSCGYNFKSGKKTSMAVSSLDDVKPPPAHSPEDDPNTMSPGKMILSGLALMAIAVALFYYLWDFENSNDPSRSIYWLIAVLYNFGGKYVATMPFFLLGLAGTVKGMYDMRKA